MVFDPFYSFQISEGQASAVITKVKQLIKDPLPTFQRMVVLETISDPSVVDDNKIDYWRHVIKVSNVQFARALARNTIIAQRILTGITEVNQPMFFLPFFPSHLSLPCKAGEVVWTMFEDPNARIKEMGFWFCKVAAPHFIDDVNHTHFPQQLDHSFNTTIEKKMAGKDEAIYELQNGKVNSSKNGERFIVDGSKVLSVDYLKPDNFAFEKLVTESDSSKMTQYESVPRFKKRPGDIALEGTNNTLIVLGTDRTGPISNYETVDEGLGGTIPVPPEADLFGSAGSIDIVTGRGMLEKTGGKPASLISLVDGQELYETLEKHKTVAEEGDPDFVNDRSRVLISQRTSVDKNFKINDYLKFAGISDDPQGDAAVVIKSDKVRIIARSDISFIVTNYVENPENNEIKKDDDDVLNWASITIKRSGDIIFTPSASGVIKLGGEDANQAILCTNRIAKVEDGEVDALPIATTGGGFVGTAGGNTDDEAVNLVRAPDLGTFSTKVLIK
jgi:hypothetical protein